MRVWQRASVHSTPKQQNGIQPLILSLTPVCFSPSDTLKYRPCPSRYAATMSFSGVARSLISPCTSQREGVSPRSLALSITFSSAGAKIVAGGPASLIGRRPLSPDNFPSPSLSPPLPGSCFMDAKWRRIYEEFTSLIPWWLHLKYSQFGAFCASWRFPPRNPDTLLAVIFVVGFFFVCLFLIRKSNVCFTPSWFHKSVASIQGHGAGSFDHTAVFYPSVMFLFFSPHKADSSTGSRSPLAAECT